MKICAMGAFAALCIAYCPAAHAEGDRYIAFEASPAFGTHMNVAHATLKYVPGSVDLSFGKPQFIRGELGAQLSKYFSAGLAVTYLTASTKRYDFLTTYETHGMQIDYAQSGSVSGHVDQGTLLFVGHAEYPLGRFVPIVGAGIGIAITNVSDLMLDGTTAAEDIHLYEDGGYSLAYQFSGGFDIRVLKSVSLTARYVYTNCDHPAFRTYNASIDHQHLALGIKFFF